MIQNELFTDGITDTNDIAARSYLLNDKQVNKEDGEFVLVFLRRALRAYDNPAIDAAIVLANSLKLPVVVYSQLSYEEPYACDRFHHFVLGANKELSKGLQERGIQHIFSAICSAGDDTTVLSKLLNRSAVVYIDQHFTAYEMSQSRKITQDNSLSITEVDASRLVPHSAMQGSLHLTKVFRAAHSPVREKWFNKRYDEKYLGRENVLRALPNTIDLKICVDSDLENIVARSDIDHTVKASQEHPPTSKALGRRIKQLVDLVIPNYRKDRNNPALPFSTSALSPYLHFGMTSPWEVMRAVGSSKIAKSTLWKFYDELFTWREWSHWRLAQRPTFTEFSTLPNSALKTLKSHANDPRELILTETQIYNGHTPDETFNAAQRTWRDTGWFHNNLRMFWAKQFLRWTSTPQEAWELACKFNDKQSLDGLDPATYISMRWAFGDSKPAYKEHAVYGWLAKRGDQTLLKREGFLEWRQQVLDKNS